MEKGNWAYSLMEKGNWAYSLMEKGSWVYKVRILLELSVETMERQSRGNYCSQEKDKGYFLKTFIQPDTECE